MSESKDHLMELVCNAEANTLSVKWSDELSVESTRFFQTIVSLFATIQGKKVANIIVDSGIPAGGVLTEEVINYFIRNIPGTPLRNIAILESSDYLWDDNLYQVMQLLVTSYHLPIAVELVKSRAQAMDLFFPALENKKTQT